MTEQALTPAETEQETVVQEADNADPAAELALSRGWESQENWHGKPSDWVDAKTFNDRYERRIADRERRTERQQMQKELAELRQLREEIQKERQERLQATTRVERDVLVAEAQRLEEEGDRRGAGAVYAKLAQLEAREAARQASPAPQQSQPAIDPAVQQVLQEFGEDNPAFKSPEMNTLLGIEVANVARFNPNMGYRQLLDLAGDRVRRLYSEKFTVKRAPPMAETAGRTNGALNGSSRQKTWNDLKQESRDAYERFNRINPMKKEDWLANATDRDFRA